MNLAYYVLFTSVTLASIIVGLVLFIASKSEVE